MEICASVLTDSDYTQFYLKCMYCTTETELKDWEQFVLHLCSAHHFVDEDEESARSEEQIVDMKEEHLDAWFDSDLKSEYEQYDEIMESMEAEAVLSPKQTDDIRCSNVNEMFEVLDNGEPDITGDKSKNRALQALAEDHDMTEDGDNFIDYFEDEQTSSNESDEELEANPSKRCYAKPIKRKLKVSFIRQNPRVLQFIEEMKKHPCLWNPNDVSFGDDTAVGNAYNSIIEVMDKQEAVIFTKTELQKSIRQLFRQYTLASQQEHLTGMPARYLQKCKFLSVTGSHVKSEDDEDDESAKTDIIQLNFKESNDLTTTFIKTFEKFPELYDSTVPEFKSLEAREQAYVKIAKLLEPKVRVNETEAHLAIIRLRKWVYMTLRRVKSKELRRACSKSELHYLAQCNFLPPKSQGFVINCEICNKRFFIDYSLRAHMVKVHKIGEMPYLCSQCPRRFEKLHDLERHNLRQHCEKLLKCTFCDSAFALKADLNVHIRVHTGEKPFVCEHCGKSFRLKLLMEYHIDGVHHDKRPFACDMCPNTYRKRVQLKNHVKGHLNIKDKKCEYCGAAFTCPTSLSRHRRGCSTKHKNKS